MNIETPAVEITRHGPTQSSTPPDAKALFLEALQFDGFDKSGKKIGRPSDARKAVGLYREAAMHGYGPAMYNYALCCIKGEGVPSNHEYRKEAVEWFRKAAEAGIAAAYNNLGYCYDRGIGGLERDLDAAEKHYGLAADMGDPTGKKNLSELRDHRAQERRGYLMSHGRPDEPIL